MSSCLGGVAGFDDLCPYVLRVTMSDDWEPLFDCACRGSEVVIMAIVSTDDVCTSRCAVVVLSTCDYS